MWKIRPLCRKQSMRYVWGYFVTFNHQFLYVSLPFLQTWVSDFHTLTNMTTAMISFALSAVFALFIYLFLFDFRFLIYHCCCLLCLCLSGVLPSTATSRKRLFYPEHLQQPFRGGLRRPMPAWVWPPGHEHQTVPGRWHLVRIPCQVHRWGRRGSKTGHLLMQSFSDSGTRPGQARP